MLSESKMLWRICLQCSTVYSFSFIGLSWAIPRETFNSCSVQQNAIYNTVLFMNNNNFFYCEACYAPLQPLSFLRKLSCRVSLSYGLLIFNFTSKLFLSYSDSTFFMLWLRLYFVQFQLLVLIRIYDLPGSHSFCHFIPFANLCRRLFHFSPSPPHRRGIFICLNDSRIVLHGIVETNNYLKVESFRIELLEFFATVFLPLGKSYVSHCVNIFTAIFSL